MVCSSRLTIVNTSFISFSSSRSWSSSLEFGVSTVSRARAVICGQRLRVVHHLGKGRPKGSVCLRVDGSISYPTFVAPPCYTVALHYLGTRRLTCLTLSANFAYSHNTSASSGESWDCSALVYQRLPRSRTLGHVVVKRTYYGLVVLIDMVLSRVVCWRAGGNEVVTIRW